jgi:hypothetical protein
MRPDASRIRGLARELREEPFTAEAVWLRTVDQKVRAPSLGRDRAVADVRYAVNAGAWDVRVA